MIYNLELSTKKIIQITEYEKNKFVNNVKATFVVLGNEIINPSFVVSITVDKEASRQEKLNAQPRLSAPEKDVEKLKSFIKNNKPNFIKNGK